MPHQYEDNFHEDVAGYLESHFGEDNVDHELYLPQTGRYCDFWVTGPLTDYAIEVENDWEAAIQGVGQSLLYAAHAANTIPVVIVPDGHIEEPEASLYRQRAGVAILELDF